MDKGLVFWMLTFDMVAFCAGLYLPYSLVQLFAVKRLRSWGTTYGRITELGDIIRSSGRRRRGTVSLVYSDNDGLEHTSVKSFMYAGSDSPYEVGSRIFLLYKPE